MNKFLSIIRDISIPNKYTNWYSSIIENSLDKNIPTYTERHHIVPKSFAKELSIIDIHSPENLVNLTAKEHFICHRLLTKMFQGAFKRKMSYAIHRLTYSQNGRKRESYVSSRHYEIVRKQHSANLTGEGNPMFGKSHSPETKEKIREKAKKRRASKELKDHYSKIRKGEGNPMYGKTHTAHARQKISDANKGERVGKDNFFYGKTHTAETKKRISAARKSQPKTTCPHCSKTVDPSNYKRWHGNNCKYFNPGLLLQ